MATKVIKNVIAPLQGWLLSQGRCVACGTSLEKGKKSNHNKGTKITCKCGRIYIKDKKENYRRALLTEV